MKATVLGIVFFAWVSIGWCDIPFSEAVQQSQRAAVQAYPELGVQHSQFNDLFTARCRHYQFADPEYFKNDQWPLLIAKECVQELAHLEKERAAIETRRQALKDFHAPEPAATPFDSDLQKRKEYLAAYQDGYRQVLVLRRRIRFMWGPFTPHMDGWNEGTSVACRDHPEIFATSTAPNTALQPTAGASGVHDEIQIDLRPGGG